MVVSMVLVVGVSAEVGLGWMVGVVVGADELGGFWRWGGVF